MNKQTIVLVLLAILLFIPTGVALHAYSIDKYDRMTREGGVATVVAHLYLEKKSPETPVVPQPLPTQSTCDKCRGTHKMRSGDGLIEIPCPCGAACKCQPMKSDIPRTKKIVLITDIDWCSPCQQIDQYTLPRLKEGKWVIGKDGHVEVYDHSDNPALVEKYGIAQIPTWIVIENDKEIRRYSGFLNDYGVLSLWNNKEPTANEKILIVSKTKK